MGESKIHTKGSRFPMIEFRREDAFHKAQLLRLLMEIVDNQLLSQSLYFKGGSCAALLGYLDRFSVDLDFDLKSLKKEDKIRSEFQKIFKKLNLIVDKDNSKVLEYLLKYQSGKNQRNSIKLTSLYQPFVNNTYVPKYIKEIDRIVNCQTIETMFSHKMVATIDRFEKYKAIAGRDIYDAHHFFLQGYSYSRNLIEERTGLTTEKFLEKLIKFINQHVNLTIVTQDLNTLLPYDKFQRIRKVLINEILMFLTTELDKIKTPAGN